MLDLYNAKQSTCSQKVRIALAEKRLEFVEHQLKLFKQEQLRPEYLALNPNGVVPTLVHDGDPITDSSVIIEYIDEVFPEPRLSPVDPKPRAAMRAWMRFFEEVPTPAVRYPSYNAAFVRHFSAMSQGEFTGLATSKPLRDKFLGEMDKDKGFSDDKIKAAENNIRKTVVRMESTLKDQPWLVGGEYSLADICVLPQLARMDDLGYASLWEDLPGVGSWLARSKARNSFRLAFYPGSLLSEQYPDVREWRKRRAAAA